MKPSIVSADTIYATISNLFYLKQQGISARIPTREQSKNFIDNFAWSYYRQYIPYYCCFIDQYLDLNIQIELVGFKNCKISYKILSDYYRFHIFAERKDKNDEIKTKIIESNISKENLDFYFKIPINSFNFSSNKYDEYTFENGLITFKYKTHVFKSLNIP